MVLNKWNRLSKLPGGKILFSHVLRNFVPYTGTVYPEVLELRPGYCRVKMKDRRIVRNHLRSVHAAALMNFAEVASGLAFITSIPETHQAILVGFDITYLKKARGSLTAESRTPPFEISEENVAVPLESIVRDEKGEEVAKAVARWLVGPKKKK